VSPGKTDTILEVGIDYITATTTQRRTATSLDAFGSYLVDTQIVEGHKERGAKLRGYWGRAAGHAAYGRRQDGAYVRLSGALADEHWSQCLQLAENVSRLDLAVTYLPASGPTRELCNLIKQLRKKYTGRWEKAPVKVFSNLAGPEALALGSRQSNRFLRIYDKGRESGDAYFANSLRAEAELKSETAWSMAQRLDSDENYRVQIGAYLAKFISIKGMCVPWSFKTSQASLAFAGQSTSFMINSGSWDQLLPRTNDLSHVLKATAWMAIQVRPSCARLVDAGFRQEVLEALGLPDEWSMDQAAERGTSRGGSKTKEFS